jgi:hypothetical protein
MPTPEQQREYTRLSGLLQQVCIRHRHQLPEGTTSGLLPNPAHKVRLEAYDRNGKPIGTIPNEKTSSAFLDDLCPPCSRNAGESGQQSKGKGLAVRFRCSTVSVSGDTGGPSECT